MATFFDLITVHDGAFLTGDPRPRQRITRACDQCHQLRTRCDGQRPCARCVELKSTCEYLRKPKKRGQAAWRRRASPPAREKGAPPPAATAAAAPSVSAPSADHAPASADDASPQQQQQQQQQQQSTKGARTAPADEARGPSLSTPDSARDAADAVHDVKMSLSDDFGAPPHLYQQENLAPGDEHALPTSPSALGPGFFTGLPSPGHAFPVPPHGSLMHVDTQAGVPSRFGGFAPPAYSPQRSDHSSTGSFMREAAGMSGAYGQQRAMWSPSQQVSGGLSFSGPDSLIAADMKLRYPVLAPLMPHLINIISASLATTLLESYFSTFTSNSVHPLSPYIQTFIFRRASILHPTNPRKCSPALLCSMLWLAAQTSEAPALTDGPSSRTRISQKLLELTVELLKPLRHQKDPQDERVDLSASNHGRESVFLPPAGNPLRAASENTFSLSSSIDHIVTYMHLGTVCSASEHKGSSIRWWSVAWAMARDMKLNREVPRAEAKEEEAESLLAFPERLPRPPSPTHYMSEEEREERRRIWWSLYMIDRHLSLCYNQPLTLLDVECEALAQPLEERLWQQLEGEELERALFDTEARPLGPQTKCYNLSIFGYFLPLMSILGGIIDLVRARNHPRFGRYGHGADVWNNFAAEISMQLDEYRYSLESLSATVNQQDADEALQQRIATAYGTHIMHVMHILLTGKWDPVNLLDDEDGWVSTPSFVNSADHATSAAEAISSIFDDDFDLSFMPWFFGIYLLQGSFLLLLVAEKLQSQTAPQVLKACETIVRAHEACVVTLDNEYQRNFRKIMISAIAQVKGRRTEDQFVQQQRRREVLSLYRWTGSGGGLVL